ncbi:hypothetical protein K438DRAFT_1053103 [Mycena galopus ATCC 62051]|nr:hypothetical protein K438DRAFT_1053103 [Mycena galopus ATCC 62051]
MEMFAQLIIEENIFLQTLPVASEHDQPSWHMDFGCKIPPHAPTFCVTILRQSKTEGTRLLGHVEIKIPGSMESNRGILQLELNKVNLDGPSLKFSAGFSVSELTDHEVSGLDLTGMPENTIASVNIRGLGNELQKMYEESRPTDALKIWVMHERILLAVNLPSNETRAQGLNILGCKGNLSSARERGRLAGESEVTQLTVLNTGF